MIKILPHPLLFNLVRDPTIRAIKMESKLLVISGEYTSSGFQAEQWNHWH
jgi:hypothetical protein